MMNGGLSAGILACLLLAGFFTVVKAFIEIILFFQRPNFRNICFVERIYSYKHVSAPFAKLSS